MPHRLIPLLRAALQILDEASKTVGFRSTADFLSSALNVRAYPVEIWRLYLSGVTLLSIASFVSHWLWNPPVAALVLLVLDGANFLYGYRVAVRLKGDTFRLSELGRTGGKIVATLLVLFVVHNTIKGYPYSKLLSDAIFWWLFGGKFSKLGLKMTALKVQEKGLPRLLGAFVGQLLKSKIGPWLVDSLQTHPPQKATPPPTSE